MELANTNDLNEENSLHATFGLKLLQILMSNSSTELDSRWNIEDIFDNSYFCECVSRTPQDLFADLDVGKYIRYSSIMIIIDRVELCDKSHIKLLFEKLESNRYLRYTPIFVICDYSIDPDSDNFNDRLDTYFSNIKLRKYPGTHALSSWELLYPNNFAQQMAAWDERYNKSRKLNNVFLMQLFNVYQFFEYRIFMFTILSLRDQSVLEVMRSVDVSFEFIITTSSNDSFYFFNINPTLAIVINNYYFTSPLAIREGSEMDVMHLIREFKLDKIPYILIEDSDRDKLLAMVKFLQQTDFKVLKRLMIFVMSHGGNANTIFTHDGEINTDSDIVQCLLSNESLKSVQKGIVFVHCRGDTDIEMEEVTPDLLKSIKPTDGNFLSENTTLLYSTPASMVSYRWPQIGTPAVLSFCKNYRNMSLTDTMDFLWRNIEKDIKDIELFEELNNCTELVSSSTLVPQRVKSLRIATDEMLDLIRHFLKYFPSFPGTSFSPGCGLFNVITFWNQLKYFKFNNNIALYGSPDLDADVSKADDAWPKLKELQRKF